MITALPSPPSTSDSANFTAKADAFLGALPGFVTEANATAVAMNLNSTTDTSASSVAIGTGAKSFTVSAGKSFQPGMYLVIADTAAPSTNSMFGQITSYDVATGALVMSIATIKGSGTKAAWVISQSSAGGAAAGANGDITSLTGLTSALYATGQCRLSKSGANLLLSPYGGNTITVNGRSCTIPDAGVTLAATGLLATTLYYVYAVATAGVITSLEASTTGHSVDTTAGNKGVEIKTGDSTRSLVGMAYCKTAATFADSSTQRFVRSWFNDPGIATNNIFAANSSSSVAAYTEISSAIRNEFAIWSGETVTYSLSGTTFNNAAGNVNYSGVGIDVTNDVEYGANAAYAAAASEGIPIGVMGTRTGLAEGFHFATAVGKPSVGTATWVGGALAHGCRLSITAGK